MNGRCVEKRASQVPDFRDFRCPLKLSPHASVGIWQSAEFERACENPILCSRKLRGLFPRLQAVQQITREHESFRRAFCLHIINNLLHDAAPDAEL